MNEKQLCIEAIRRVAKGETVTKVCADLNRSRTWYYKWKERFRQGGAAALRDQRGGFAPSNATPKWIQDMVIDVRDRLVKQAQNGNTYQGVGAREVARELAKLDINVPHWRTIHSILKKAGRIPDQEAKSYCPRPEAECVNAVHQVDIWPRILRGGERLSFFHLVDVACWYPYGMVAENKTSDTALKFLVASWKELGLPKVAQFDNEMTFTGGRWAHRFGRVVRLCLMLGIQPWFIPFYTPERNGYVEGFHGQCGQFFWSRTRFGDRLQVQEAYPSFLSYFRTRRRLPAIHLRTPAEMREAWPDVPIQFLPADFCLHKQEHLPLVDGYVFCVRLADHQGQINVLNHHLTLGAKYAKHYVLAKITIGQEQMALFIQPTSEDDFVKIKTEPFPVQEPVCDFRSDFDYTELTA